MQFFPGSFSIFRPFKWSQHCYLFCKVWKKNYILKNIPSNSPALRRPEFIDQSFLPNKLRSLDIFKKIKIVPSLYRDIHPGDSWPYVFLCYSFFSSDGEGEGVSRYHMVRNHQDGYPYINLAFFCCWKYPETSIYLKNYWSMNSGRRRAGEC